MAVVIGIAQTVVGSINPTFLNFKSPPCVCALYRWSRSKGDMEGGSHYKYVHVEYKHSKH